MLNKYLLFFIFFAGSVLSCTYSYGQSYRFNHITTDDGLSTGNVRSIVQDYQGFFWFGTEDGLHRYDGYDMKVYYYDQNDTTSISSNFILSIFEDSFHNLWIGTIDGGLCLYDRKKDSFIRFNHDPNNDKSIFGNYIRCLFETSDHKLFVGIESGGLSYISLSSNISPDIEFNNFGLPISDKLQGANWVSAIVEKNDGDLIVGSNGAGLFSFNPSTTKFQSILESEVTMDIHSLFIDSKDYLWVGTWQSGLFVHNFKNGKTVHYSQDDNKFSICHNQIESVEEDHLGNFWIATDNGVNIFPSSRDPFTQTEFITIQHNEFENESILSNAAKAFYIDKNDRIWIGTYYGGINIYDPKAIKFNAVSSKSWKENSLSFNNVFAFSEDLNGDFWVATDGGGINMVKGGVDNIYKDTYKKVNLIGKNGKLEEKAKCIVTDKKGKIWVGTWAGGLFKVDPKTGKSFQYTLDVSALNSISANEVLAIKVDDKNNLWIGTFHGGLNFFDQEKGVFKAYKNLSSSSLPGQIDKINAIFIDKKQRLFVSREVGGLNVYDKEKDSFTTIEIGQLSGDITILSIYEDHSGIYWLGTNSIGLIRYDHDNKDVRVFDQNQGLKNNVVNAIEEDANGNLWISTNKGLSFFNVKSESFVNYSKSDGLQGNQFNQNSVFKCSNGMLVFGGIKGFNAFYPNDISINEKLPKIVFTNFWLNNIELSVGKKEPSLAENIIIARSIKLQHNQNSFSVDFSALEYNFSNRNNYAYKLENFDKDWNKIGTERKATFTNLNPGTYFLKVKASNSDGMWGDNEVSILIVIVPAWYQTWVFKICVAFLILLATYVIYRTRLQYLINQKLKLAREVKQRTFELEITNGDLAEKMTEISKQNTVLNEQKLEIAEKNNEILAQNEELTAQNDQISLQREELQEAQFQLRKINEDLEKLVDNRTKKLKSTIKKLDKTVMELDRFVYSASHDLSAPLKSIRGLINVAKMEKDHSKADQYYRYIEDSILKLEDVIMSLVEFSRNNHLDVKRENFLLHYLIKDVIRELSYWPDARDVNIENDVAEDFKMVADSQRMKIVFHNIISNCVKYADFGKKNCTAKISCKTKNQGYHIMVTDNGIGIPEDRINKIFNMYYRGTEKSNGSGLGLYIVKETILKLNGSIEVFSTEGKGTTFSVTIPIMKDKSASKSQKKISKV